MARIIDVIDHVNVMDDELTYREPQRGGGDWRMGSQVIVQESQTAIFVRQGEVLDALGPGSHTLSTANLPLVSGLIGMVTSGRNPFTADLYYVNLKDLPAVPWGTNPPIVIETPDRGLGVALLVTHGVIDIGVDDPVRFVKQYGVGKPILRLNDIKDRIQAMLLGEIGSLLSSSGVASIPEANQLLGDLEGAMLARLNEQFAALGMRIKAFESKPFTAKEADINELRNYISPDLYERVRRLDIAETAADNPGMGGAMAGAGLGLGVGQSLGATMNPQQDAMQQQMQQQQMMMQQMMMQMMQNNQPQQQQAPPPAAPASAPAAPQTAAEIQATIDSLDVRFANGEISEAVYMRLVDKWQAKLDEMS
ncbi:SPFH domain-containing protein [Chloroflexota bacterium]